MVFEGDAEVEVTRWSSKATRRWRCRGGGGVAMVFEGDAEVEVTRRWRCRDGLRSHRDARRGGHVTGPSV